MIPLFSRFFLHDSFSFYTWFIYLHDFYTVYFYTIYFQWFLYIYSHDSYTMYFLNIIHFQWFLRMSHFSLAIHFLTHDSFNLTWFFKRFIYLFPRAVFCRIDTYFHLFIFFSHVMYLFIFTCSASGFILFRYKFLKWIKRLNDKEREMVVIFLYRSCCKADFHFLWMVSYIQLSWHVAMPTGYKFRYGQTFGKLTSNSLELSGTRRKIDIEEWIMEL